jgi:hypothetical protein
MNEQTGISYARLGNLYHTEMAEVAVDSAELFNLRSTYIITAITWQADITLQPCESPDAL